MSAPLARDIQQIEKEISALSERERSVQRASYTPTPPLPQVSYAPNPVLVQATGAVEMKTSPSQGRLLQASQAIKSGDTLIVERPFAAVLLPDHYSTHCHHCFAVLPTNPIGCLQCSTVLYCNEDCRDQSWTVYHCVECPYLDLLHSVGIAHLSLRIVLTAGLPFLLEFLSPHHNQRGAVAGLTSEGRYERNYLSVFDLMTHEHDMQTADLLQYSLTAALLLAVLVHTGWFCHAHYGSQIAEDWNAKFARLETFLQGRPTRKECCESWKTERDVQCSKGIREKGLENDVNRGRQADGSSTQVISHMQASGTVNSGCVTVNKVCGTVNSTGNDVHKGYKQQINTTAEESADKSLGCGDDTQFKMSSAGKLSQEKSSGCTDQPLESVLSVGVVLLQHVQQLVCNAHAITALHMQQSGNGRTVDTQSQVRIATAIYPTASLMNHSCDPTILASFVKDVLVVKSVRDVPAGGEIFNCYGPHFKRMKSSERQVILKSQYFFECQCEACAGVQSDMPISQALRCPECGNSMPVQQVALVCPSCHVSFDLADILPKLEVAEKHFTDGVQKLERGDLTGALTSLQSSLAMREKLLAADHRDLGHTHDAMAQCLAMRGHYSQAADHLSRSLVVTKMVYGADSLEVAHELHKMAEVQVNARRPRDALVTAACALRLARVHCSEEDSWVQELLCLETALMRISDDGAM